MRPDGRTPDECRPVTIQRQATRYAEGSVDIRCGETRVLCTASVEDRVPPFLKNTGKGWVTAEYALLPRSTAQRVQRDSVNKGRAKEISRLIGRSLRAVVDLEALGEWQITLDCDVLQADGGTRTTAITGAYVALRDAVNWMLEQELIERNPLTGQCAAVSVGIIDGEPRLDLCYEEDAAAEVDLNVVMLPDGRLLEIQGCAEHRPFGREALDAMLDLAFKGCSELFRIQEEAWHE